MDKNDPTTNFTGNIERFSGFADAYDKFRPEPPAVLAGILTQLIQIPRPELVVDLGSGTGLSTRYWADKADQVIGVEPTEDMRRQAMAQTTASNITYRAGFSHQTGLPGHCVQIITCSQALHWMDPQGTFQEAARILVPGGIFAAYDYDWPPVTGKWEVSAAYETCMKNMATAEKSLPPQVRVHKWDKNEHLSRMQSSGSFRYTQEIVIHQTDQGNAERMLGLFLSQGSVMTLLKAGFREEQLEIDQLRKTIQAVLGDELRTWYWSYRIRVGIA
jgi:ubiquinone/menaquinone biosynthesis C-methylase UbiE